MLPFCGLQPDADHAHVELIPAAGGTLYLRHSVLEEWLPLGAAEATLGRNDHGYAVVDFGDGKPRLAHELFLKTVHTAAGGVQHVHEKAIDSCSLLVDLHRQHAAKVFEVASQKVKVYLQVINICGAYVYWSAMMLWEACGFTMQAYRRGGSSSTRYLLDRWGAWELACLKCGVPATHMHKARTATRGPGSRLAEERVFPEMCLSSHAVLAVLLHLATTMVEPENKVKAKQLLAALCQVLLGGEACMQIFLDEGVSVTPGRDATSSMQAVLLPLSSDRVVVTSMAGHALCQRLLDALGVDRGKGSVSLVDLLCEAALKKAWWLAKQVVHSLAAAWEDDFEAKAPGLVNVVEGMVVHQPHKKRDVDVSMGLVMHNSSKKAKLEERTTKAAFAACKALRSDGDETKCVRKECFRYMQAQRALWSGHPAGDVAVATDDVRASGKEYMVTCIMEPSTGLAAWAPVQDPTS